MALEGSEAISRPHFDRGEVDRSDRVPMDQRIFRNVFQVVVRFRWGADSMPFALRMFPTVVSEIWYPTIARAP